MLMSSCSFSTETTLNSGKIQTWFTNMKFKKSLCSFLARKCVSNGWKNASRCRKQWLSASNGRFWRFSGAPLSATHMQTFPLRAFLPASPQKPPPDAFTRFLTWYPEKQKHEKSLLRCRSTKRSAARWISHSPPSSPSSTRPSDPTSSGLEGKERF